MQLFAGVCARKRRSRIAASHSAVVHAVLLQHPPAAPVGEPAHATVKYRMVTVVRLHPQSSAAALEPGRRRAGRRRSARWSRARSTSPSRSTPGRRSPPASRPGRTRSASPATSPRSALDAAGRAAGRAVRRAQAPRTAWRSCSEAFGEEIAGLAAGVEKLYQLRVATRGSPERAERGAAQDGARHGRGRARGADPPGEPDADPAGGLPRTTSAESECVYARETLDIYAPLANRLGVWQLKWELEDLSFRYLEPELYKRIAQMLDEQARGARAVHRATRSQLLVR